MADSSTVRVSPENLETILTDVYDTIKNNTSSGSIRCVDLDIDTTTQTATTTWEYFRDTLIINELDTEGDDTSTGWVGGRHNYYTLNCSDDYLEAFLVDDAVVTDTEDAQSIHFISISLYSETEQVVIQSVDTKTGNQLLFLFDIPNGSLIQVDTSDYTLPAASQSQLGGILAMSDSRTDYPFTVSSRGVVSIRGYDYQLLKTDGMFIDVGAETLAWRVDTTPKVDFTEFINTYIAPMIRNGMTCTRIGMCIRSFDEIIRVLGTDDEEKDTDTVLTEAGIPSEYHDVMNVDENGSWAPIQYIDIVGGIESKYDENGYTETTVLVKFTSSYTGEEHRFVVTISKDANFPVTYTRVSESSSTESVGMTLSVVDTLPITGEEMIIYLVPTGKYIWDSDSKTIVLDPDWVEPTDAAKNTKDEYIWLEDHYEPIGSTEVDLSDYLKKDDLRAMTDDEVAELISRAKGETT